MAADPPSSDRLLAGEVLGVPEAEVRAAGAEPELPHAFDAGWKGEPVCEVLHDTEAVRIARCSFPPGVGHEKHVHRPHFGYVLTGGTMRIADADGVETVETRAGATWTSDETTVHQVVNVGDTTTSYLIVEPKGALMPLRDSKERPHSDPAEGEAPRDTSEDTAPEWFGALRRYARRVQRHDMEAIRENVARGVARDRGV